MMNRTYCNKQVLATNNQEDHLSYHDACEKNYGYHHAEYLISKTAYKSAPTGI
jgi:hypothetical protein